MITPNTPMLLFQEVAAAAGGSGETVTDAALGSGSDVAVLIALAVILVGGIVALFAGDRVRRSESVARSGRADASDGLAH